MPSMLFSTTANTLLLLLSLLPLLLRHTAAQQQQSLEGWSDDYKLDYSYDSLGDQGPAHWGNAGGGGEWDVVRASARNIDNGDALFDDLEENQCGTEQRPSPIELIPSAACQDTQELKVRQVNTDMDCRHPLEEERPQDDATDQWELTPYSLRYYLPRTDRSCRPPTVRLDQVYANVDRRNVEEHFVLLWLELHARSEHVVDGKRYDAELQMVHASTTRPNELVVVSVLLDASAGAATQDDSDFQRYLLDGWQRKHQEEVDECDNGRRTLQGRRRHRHLRGELRQTPGYAAALRDYQRNATLYYTPPDETKTSRTLQKCTGDAYGNGCSDEGMMPRQRTFPYNLWPSVWYYSYEGSLTAPPCAGQVHWRIMDTPLAISRRQYKQLTYLLTQSRDESCRLDTATTLQGENFRPLQNATLSSATDRQGGQQQQQVNAKQGGNNNNNEDTTEDGPQVVSHCTQDDFFVTLYEEDDR